MTMSKDRQKTPREMAEEHKRRHEAALEALLKAHPGLTREQALKDVEEAGF
jgi:hypothetical protein